MLLVELNIIPYRYDIQSLLVIIKMKEVLCKIYRVFLVLKMCRLRGELGEVGTKATTKKTWHKPGNLLNEHFNIYIYIFI